MMVAKSLPVNGMIILQIIQITLRCCYAQLEEAQSELTIYDETDFQRDLDQSYEQIPNFQESFLVNPVIDEQRENLGEEKHRPMLDIDGNKSNTLQKRRGQYRRKSGKTRRLTKHSKHDAGEMPNRNEPALESEDQGEMTNQETVKYPEYIKHNAKGSKTKVYSSLRDYNTYTGNSNRKVNNSIDDEVNEEDDSIKSVQTNLTKDSMVGDTMNNSLAKLYGNYSSETLKEWPQKSKKRLNTNRYNTENNFKTDKQWIESSSNKKHKKIKNKNFKYYKSNKINPVDGERINNYFSTIQPHIDDEVYSQIYDLNGTKYANMSIINQGFLAALGKKFNILGEEADAKKKTKPTEQELEKMKNVIWLDRPTRVNNKVSEKTSNSDEYDSNDQQHKTRRGHKHKPMFSTSNEKHLQSEINVSAQQSQNTDVAESLANIEHVKQKKLKHEVRENIRDSESNDQHKRRSKKIMHGEGSVKTDLPENMSSDYPDMDISNYKNVSSLPRDTLQEVTNKRNERDVEKNKFRPKSHWPNNNVRGRNVLSHLESRADDDSDQFSDNTEFEKDQMLLQEHDRNKLLDHQRPRLLTSGDGYFHKVSDPKRNYYTFESENFDIGDSSKKLYARRAQDVKNNDESKDSVDTCIGYKSDRVSSSSTTEPTTESIQTSQTTTKRLNNSKSKTTQKMTTKSYSSDKNQNSSYDDEIDLYEQFLCGQLADNFVNAVLTKLKRTKKILNELGFQNDTGETCERCIEMKEIKFPEVEVIRSSLGKCFKTNESKQSISKCYKIPSPMEDFLHILMFNENEHENRAYNKIKDDSSFIFAGDYPESLIQNDNNPSLNSQYNGDRAPFSKDSLEKQHLKEDGYEDKNEDQISNRNYLENTGSHSKDKGLLEYSTRRSLEDNENQDVEMEDRVSNHKDKKAKETKYDYDEHHSLHMDENLKGNELIDVFDSQDLAQPIRSKGLADETQNHGFSGLFGRLSKHRDDEIGALKSNEFNNNRERDEHIQSYPLSQLDDEIQHYYSDGNSLKNRPISQTYGDTFNSDSRHNSYFLRDGERQDSLFQQNVGGLQNSPRSKSFWVPSIKRANRGNHRHNIYSQHQYPISDAFNDKYEEAGEYSLFPNLQTRQEHMSRSRHYDYDDGIRIAKRETDSSDEYDPVFLEVPDIEYDLY